MHWRTLAPKIIKCALEEKEELEKKRNCSKVNNKGIEPDENKKIDDASQEITRINVNYSNLLEVLDKYQPLLSTRE